MLLLSCKYNNAYAKKDLQIRDSFIYTTLKITRKKVAPDVLKTEVYHQMQTLGIEFFPAETEQTDISLTLGCQLRRETNCM